jgi:hypothetical protein
MKISNRIKIFFFYIAVFILPTSAALACDKAYDTCVEKCNQIENAPETCYNTCDVQYAQCLDKEQNGFTETDLQRDVQTKEITKKSLD